jgi:hypothetical protein
MSARRRPHARPLIVYLEEEMNDDRNPTNGGAKTAERQQLDPKDFELAKAIRSEVFGYVTRGALLAVTPVLGFIGFVLWGYIEWRLPQIAGGVPKNAVVAFAQGSCPEGWTYFVRARSHVIVGSEPDSESPNDTYQLLDHSGEPITSSKAGGLIGNRQRRF